MTVCSLFACFYQRSVASLFVLFPTFYSDAGGHFISRTLVFTLIWMPVLICAHANMDETTLLYITVKRSSLLQLTFIALIHFFFFCELCFASVGCHGMLRDVWGSLLGLPVP